MARTVRDAALMLTAIAGADARVPISYDLDPRTLARAVRSPEVRGWRVAWTPDLAGLLPVDAEIATVAERATEVFRSLGARVVAACPDFSEVGEIVLTTRGLSMVAQHADRVARWRDQMQAGLVWNVEQGLALDARTIARGETQRSVLWHRVRAFMEDHDLLILPTTPVKPFPVEQPYPTEIGGRRLDHYIHWAFLTYAITLTGLPVISVPCGFTRDGLPVGLQIVGGWRRDDAVLRAAAAFEEACPWAQVLPPTVRELAPSGTGARRPG